MRGIFGARLLPQPDTVGMMPWTDRGGVQANLAAAIGNAAPAPMPMAQPVAMPNMAAQPVRARPGFNDAGGLGDQFRTLAGHMMLMGGMEGAGRNLLDEVQQRGAALARLNQQQAEWDHEAAVKAGDRQYEENKPEYFSLGRDRVRYDPASGQTQTLYSAPLDAEAYAAGMGYERGTPKYIEAMQDYTLRGNGPTAYGYDVGLENTRQGNRVALEGVRQSNRMDLRQTPTYANLHPRTGGGGSGGGGRLTMAGTMAPILAKVARGQTLSPGEQQAWAMYKSGRSGKGSGASTNAGGGVAEGATATGPNGQKLVRRGNQWVPLR